MPGPVEDDAAFILETHLGEVRHSERASFHMPGHKGGRGAPASARRTLGEDAYRADLSELSGFDYLHGSHGAIERAQARAAAVFGADRSWFLVNGATVGNLAAISAVVRDGEKILVGRDSHRSVYAGLALSGACPVYLRPARNERLDGLFGLELDDVREALDAHPDARAIHLTSPSYYGLCEPVEEVAELAHRRGMALIVDEAHGSHFRFSDQLPRPALDCGADLVVHSPHKTLGSLTQSSLLHLSGPQVSAERVSALLGDLQSSSPSALLLVSLDSAIAEMAAHGKERWTEAVSLAVALRTRLASIEGVCVYGDELEEMPGIAAHDPTKLVLDVDGLDTTGFAAGNWLRAERGVNPEFSDLRRMVFSITTGDTDETAAVLVAAIEALARATHELASHRRVTSLWPLALPVAALTPRQAHQHDAERVRLDRAAGRVSADMVVPYPPGVPLVVPGEVLDRPVLDAMEQLRAAGARIVGTPDPQVRTLRVLDRA